MANPSIYSERAPRSPLDPKPAFEFGLTLSRTFSGFFGNIGPIVGFYGLTIIATWVFSLTLSFIGGKTGVSEGNSEESVFTILTMLNVFFIVLLWVAFHAFCMIVAHHRFMGRDYKFRDVGLQAVKVAVPLLLIAIIFVICYYIGFLLLFVPGFIIAAGWSILGPAYLFDGVGIKGSFGRSWALTKGYKWRVWFLTIIVELTFVAVWLLMMPVTWMALGVESGMNASSGLTDPAFVVSNVVILLVSLTYFGMSSTMRAAIHVHCCELKDRATPPQPLA